MSNTGDKLELKHSASSGVACADRRNMIFISHANPEDNKFAEWLALRLAREGYPVWCDVTKLLGGEDFWRDIEAAIRERTIKFLFVLSKCSNEKQGTLMEVAVARKVGRAFKDFIIPLRVDDIRSDDVTIELNRLNYIDFSKSWLDGCRQLLTKLEDDGIQKDPRFTPDAVTKWWRERFSATEGVRTEAERYASNWFEFVGLPERLRLHAIEPRERFEKAELAFTVPVYPYENCLISFAEPVELAGILKEQELEIDNTVEVTVEDFQQRGLEHPKIERRDARNILSALFREGFEKLAMTKGLLPYELANGAKFYWFKKGLAEDDKVFYRSPDRVRNWRAMVGFKSLHSVEGRTRLRNWHFGIQVKPYFWPFLILAVKPHVIFTENGVLYESKAKQHSARRSQCKSWYNDDWLDRILAAMSFLSGEDVDDLIIPLASHVTLSVNKLPLLFESPVSYEIVEKEAEYDGLDHDDGDDEMDEEEEE